MCYVPPRFAIPFVSFFIFISIGFTYAQDTFADDFNPRSYTRNDGNQNFSNNWFETNESTNAAAGKIQIVSDQLRFENLDNVMITRRLDLSGYSSVVLTFDYNTTNGNESIQLQLRDQNGVTWMDVDPEIRNSGTFTYTLAPNFISANAGIRFKSGSGNWENGETIFIDNLLFTAYNTPPTNLTIADITVNETDGLATFTATLTGAPGPFTVNYATQEGTAFADSDYMTTAGTLTFAGTVATENRTFTVPLIDNQFLENDETFTIALSNPSNTAVGLVNGTATIQDNAGDTAIASDVPLTLFDQFNGYYDYASTGASYRIDSSCNIKTTASNVLTDDIIPGATIEKAYLIWAHSGANADDVVTFEGQSVTANVMNKANADPDQIFYSMVGDVTTIIKNIPDLSTNVFDLTDLKIDNSAHYCNPRNFIIGGWALYIFYKEDSLTAVRINMYNGFDAEKNKATVNQYVLDDFYAIDNEEAKATVLSWEGDVTNASDELLSITTSTGTYELDGDGDNVGAVNNPFNSTIFNETTGLNTSEKAIDLDTYDISDFITQGETSVTTNVKVGGDFIVLNSVLMKVPGNLIGGVVYEDVNYPGGVGRDLVTSSGNPLENVTVELYRETTPSTYVLEETVVTEPNGVYIFGGMANGNFKVRVLNQTITSTRGGGNACANCIPVQTFRRNYNSVSLTDINTEIGGANPAFNGSEITGSLVNAQSVSDVTINNGGIADIHFGFNFNTIVNTNDAGQGSLRQFIINANALDQTGLNIDVHPNDAGLNPAAGEDSSVFMIPTASDPFGRTTDARYNAQGYFDIRTSSGNFPNLNDQNTVIEGRSQTAYSGNTNVGSVNTPVSNVGTGNTGLPTYNFPEIQIRQNHGTGSWALQINANNCKIKNVAVYGTRANTDAIRVGGGAGSVIDACLIGTNARGARTGGTRYACTFYSQGAGTISNSFIRGATINGVQVNTNATSSVRIRGNYLLQNGRTRCDSNVEVVKSNAVFVENNLIQDATGIGVDLRVTTAPIMVSQNTIFGNGTNGTCNDNFGIRISKSNVSVLNNRIYNNAAIGINLAEANTSANLISQNSIYANGIGVKGLGIDIGNDGVTLNDTNDTDTGPNGRLNFPFVQDAKVFGNALRIKGWAPPGAVVEVFLTDVQEGTATVGDNQVAGPLGAVSVDFGEGQTFLGSATEGSAQDLDTRVSQYFGIEGMTDTSNRFDFSIPLSISVRPGDLITTTATVSNGTSEFSNSFEIGRITVITNRNITYRVNPN